MAGYFSQLPKVEYPSMEDDGATSLVLTNILTRSAFLRDIMENTALFYDYQVKDGETPEIIADKLYGDPNRFWIVLLFNNLSNAFYDFPLTSEQLADTIQNKYGYSVTVAQSTIHHYELQVVRTVLFNGIVQTTNEQRYTISAQEQDDSGIAVPNPSLPGTADTSVSAGSTTESFDNGVTVQTDSTYWAISTYAYEMAENEKRRSIKLLDKGYVINVENEFRRLMRNVN